MMRDQSGKEQPSGFQAGFQTGFEGNRLPECPACGSKKIAAFRTGVDYHYGIEGEYSTDRCANCGLVFLNPMPTVAELARFYPDDYYSYQPPELETGWKRGLAEFVGLRKQTYLPSFPSPGRALDLGCGAGHYLLKLRSMGWEVHGSELSKAAAAAGRSVGLDIRSGELTEAGFPADHFDFVRSNHSFEHIPNPDVILAEIKRILKPGGTLFVGVPNLDSFWARHFGPHWWYFGLPVHTHNYDSSNLPKLLERHGFRVRKLLWNSDYASSTGSLQIRRNARHGVASSGGPLLESWTARIIGHVLAKVSDIFRQGDCIEVIAVKDR